MNKTQKSKIKKDREYETFITFRKPLNEPQKDNLQKDLRKYGIREVYYLSSDKTKNRREWFHKKSLE